jgi:Phage tail baseplate hub (GPD)
MAKKPHLSIKLEGSDKPLDPLARVVTIEDNDRLVDEARLTFADPDGKGAELVGDGKKVTIELGWDEEFTVLFEGLVVERKPDAGAGGMKTVTVVARDLSHKMSKEPHTVLHPEGTLDTIVKKVASQNGWSGPDAHITCDPNPKLTELNDLKQVAETDYQYLQRLAQLYGARAFVEYNDGRSQFYFVSNRTLLEADALGRLEYCRGLNKLIEFKYESVAARCARQLTLSVVDPLTGDLKTATGETPPAAAPTAPEGTATPPAAPTPATGQPSDPDRAKQVTIFDPTRVLGLRGQGRAVGTIFLRAKGKVEIMGIAPWAEGDWYVSKATHTWRDVRTAEDVKKGGKRSSYETSFTATR